jgi:hypothetical protein
LTGMYTSIASSSDGTKLAATGSQYPDLIYTSADSGATWTAVASSLGKLLWGGIAISSDGTKLAAVSLKFSRTTSDSSQIYTSTDSGASWTAVASSRNWYHGAIASSSDGTKLAACEPYSQGQIYIGTNNPFSAGSAGTTGTFQYVGNGRWVRVVQAP